MTEFRDHFSTLAESYSAHRPTYPPELFEVVSAAAPRRDVAWDCATGNGQAALGLAACFERVIATDGSAEQIGEATPHERVEYRVAVAESSGLDDASVDIVTVAQALHWFDHDAFYREVERVMRPDGVFVAWAYALATVSTEVDAVVGELYSGILDGCWPARRRYIDEAYATVPFPFDEIATPELEMSVMWSADQVIAYISTWSAVDRYRRDRGACPIELVRDRLRSAWGEDARRVRWPLHLRMGHLPR